MGSSVSTSEREGNPFPALILKLDRFENYSIEGTSLELVNTIKNNYTLDPKLLTEDLKTRIQDYMVFNGFVIRSTRLDIEVYEKKWFFGSLSECDYPVAYALVYI